MRKSVKFSLTLVAAATLAATYANAANSLDTVVKPTTSTTLQEASKERKINRASPARNIDRSNVVTTNATDAEQTSINYRTINGSNNNLSDPEMGETHTHLSRLSRAAYADGISEVNGADRPNVREISNLIFGRQNADTPNFKNASDLLWQWGQFIDHDFGLTEGTHPEEPADIIIPTGDKWFDPDSTGTATLAFNRSIYDETTGTTPNNPREQINEITTWIDGSNVYGSDAQREAFIRANDGTGMLKVSDRNLLPFNTAGLPNAGGSGAELFLAGDVRANEQIGLTAMHTLFVREHNRLAIAIKYLNPSLSGDEIYQKVRKLVGAEIQKITYEEFLPILLGENALPEYTGYNPDIHVAMSNEFTTAAFRLGHSLLNKKILRLDKDLNDVGSLRLRRAFFRPDHIIKKGIDVVLRGQAMQVAQEIDAFVIPDVRNFLFGQPGDGGFDLVALNLHRGRDHGLPTYNDVREAIGLPRITAFNQISSVQKVKNRLKAAYPTVDDIDLWVGGLAEDNFGDAMVGETFFNIMVQQFKDLRDGDRFFYLNDLSDDELALIADTTLAKVIKNNTNVGDEIGPSAFIVE
ncbi:peroxidase family protein [Alteromonas sp. a30]|uniref:peroxidase family protein n=1 Tax=Alteromonas sp. a30 TaxID=2730917 RepID=UPI002280933D|nr:peroxidase family protein [Alteromonas sp. a30]MCY7296304.1 peroxiredoxin [Alteromonas sp. a30]